MKAAVFLFLFLTLFNPVSTNITVLFNIGLFLFFRNKVHVNYRGDLIYPVVLLILCVISMSRFGKFDATMLGIYGRMLISFLVIPCIVSYFFKKGCLILELLNFCLLLHCCVVIIQLFFPELEWINQAIFRYERDMESLKELSSRRLGLAGSFDVAGYYAAACSIMSYFQYVFKKDEKYLVYLFISTIASIFTSRTGMSLGLIGVGAVYLLYGKNHTSLAGRYLLVAFVFSIGFYIVYPIVSGNYGSIDLGSNYGDNTMLYLSQIHLLPLYLISWNQFIFGVGTLISNVSNTYGWSDIGYVKQIFEVGIVGVLLMVFFCVRVCYKSFKNKRMSKFDSIMIAIMAVLVLLFNYKNEFLWQVGVFDLFLIVYYYQKSKSRYSKNGLL